VLRVLAVRGPCDGWRLCGFIRSASRELLRVEEGSLYPALHLAFGLAAAVTC
jgi:hypothetical protein